MPDAEPVTTPGAESVVNVPATPFAEPSAFVASTR